MRFMRLYLRCIAFVGLLTPLMVYTGFVAPYVFTQTVFLQSLVMLSIVPLAVLWIYDPSSRPVRSMLYWFVAVWLVSMTLSAFYGIDPTKSVWGVWGRFGSIMDWLAVLFYGLLVVSIVRSRDTWIRYVTVLCGVATIVSIYALLQLVPGLPVFDSGVRVFGTVGNPAFLASYLLLTIGLTLFLLRQAPARYRWLVVSSIVVQVSALIATQTKAAIIGLAVALAISFCMMLAKRGIRPMMSVGILIMILILAGTVAIMRAPYFITNQSSESRVLVWEMALSAARDRSVFGFGEGNFMVIFQRYFDPRLYFGQGHTMWFDKAHNEYLDRLALGGLIGLIAYLSLLVTTIRLPWKASRQGGVGREVAHALIPFLIAYYVYLFFFFHSIVDVLLWVTYLAFIVTFMQTPKHEYDQHAHHDRIPKTVTAVALSISLCLVGFFGLRTVYASYLIKQGMQAEAFTDAVAWYARAWDLDERGRRVIVHDIGYRMSASMTDTWIDSVPYIASWVTEVVRAHPLEIQLHRPLVRLYQSSVNDQFRRYAFDLINASILLSPGNPEPLLHRGVLLLERAAETDSIDERATSLDQARKDFAEAYRLSPSANDVAILYHASRTDGGVSNPELLTWISDSTSVISVNDWVLLVELGVYYADRHFLEQLRSIVTSDRPFAYVDMSMTRAMIDDALERVPLRVE